MNKRTVPQALFDAHIKKYGPRVAAEVDSQLRAQHKAGIFDEGNPNHPRYNNGINYATGLPVSLFGYEPKEFMARQHIKRK